MNRFIPRFTELDLFVSAYGIMLVLCVHGVALFDPSTTFAQGYYLYDYTPHIITGVLLLFVLYAARHAFSARKKGVFEKQLLLLCQLIIFIVTIIVLLLTRHGGYASAVLIVWNVLYVIWLLMWFYRVLHEEDRELIDHILDDENESHLNILLVGYVSAVFFAVMTFMYQTHWIITFAMLMLLAAPFSRALAHYSHLIYEGTHFKLPTLRMGLLLIVPLVVVWGLAMYSGV